MKSLCRGRRNLEMSIHNHYGLTSSGRKWRLPSQGGHEWCTPAAASTVAGADARKIAHDERHTAPLGKVETVELTDEAFAQIQDMWCVDDRELDEFRDRYRTAVHNRNALLPTELTPAQARRLRPNERETSFLSMPREGQECSRATFNGKTFVTSAYCKFAQSDNSHVKQTYNDVNGNRQTAYGQIERMFMHSIAPGSPQQVVLQVEWLDLQNDATEHKLPVVRRAPDSAFNRNAKYTFLELCLPYNVAVLRRDPLDSTNPDYVVIDPKGKFGASMYN